MASTAPAHPARFTCTPPIATGAGASQAEGSGDSVGAFLSGNPACEFPACSDRRVALVLARTWRVRLVAMIGCLEDRFGHPSDLVGPRSAWVGDMP